MEVLYDFGTDEQKEEWLTPLLDGSIRSCFTMTEPDVASSDATNISSSIVSDGDNYIINGRKWWTSNAINPRAKICIFMGVTNPENAPHQRQSQILVPMDSEGISIIRPMQVYGYDDGYTGHPELLFENVVVPKKNIIGGEGLGFKIAQARLGPGRIHHCMRWVGECERMFDMMCNRALTRELAPNKPLATKQTIQNWIAESRAEINASRLMVLDTAKKIDEHGADSAKVEISTIKFYVANVLQKVLDRVLQVHGALGMTDDTPIAFLYRHERAARIYDGADEVHKSRVAREILKSYSK
jgi:alkylation response protein AidB-like acyl-CoA dehydrogenase